MPEESVEVQEPLVVCIGGIGSGNCSVTIDTPLDDYVKLADVVDRVWSEEPGRPVLFVSPSLRGFSRFLRELGELGRNQFMVEVTGIPETMLSGLPIDKLIEYYAGFIAVTYSERRRAVKRRPAVTRRELLRRMFLVTPEYIIPPRGLGRGCAGSCPLGAVRDDGSVDAARCRGCMVCVHGCGQVPAWAGPATLAYAYRYLDEHSLDGILFICRERLDELDDHAVEASPAKLLPIHLPCAGWLSPRLVERLRSLGVYVHVYGGDGVCGGCARFDALKTLGHFEALRRAGAVVSSTLSEASMYSYTGYTRPRRSVEEVLRVLTGG